MGSLNKIIFMLFAAFVFCACGGNSSENNGPFDSGTVKKTDAGNMPVDGGTTLLRWPLAGDAGIAYTIVNYVDLNTAVGHLQDYIGAMDSLAKTYDGHKGTDIAIANFRTMDRGVDVMVARDGVVVRTTDGFDDRHESCINYDANEVDILHSDGTRALYLHFKKGSIRVALNQSVKAGDIIGQVGSSGCSSGPHLHFELHAPSGSVLDPFLDHLWASPPAYEMPVQLMDMAMVNMPISSLSAAQNVPEDSTSFSSSTESSFVVFLSNSKVTDTIYRRITSPSGAVFSNVLITFDKDYLKSDWYLNRTLTAETGTWRFDVEVNGTVLGSKTFVR